MPRNPWRPELLQVTRDVFCIRRPHCLSCCYFVLHRGDVVLIDAGLDPSGADVEYGLLQVGRVLADVKAILLTHWHNDHSGGAAAVKEASGAAVYYSAHERDNFTRGAVRGWRAWAADTLPEVGPLGTLKAVLGQCPARAVEATRHVSDGELLMESFVVLETPGHSPGHLSFFYLPERVLFAGDALAAYRGEIQYMSPFLTDDLTAARSSMRRCVELSADAICPGHRAPLVQGVGRARERALVLLAGEGHWPIFT